MSRSQRFGLDRQAWNTAGQLTRQANALGGVSIYTETNDTQGQKVRTTQYPDLGTRIETWFKDGQLARVTGTATQPVRYEYGLEEDGVLWRAYSKEIKLDVNGADTAQWTIKGSVKGSVLTNDNKPVQG